MPFARAFLSQIASALTRTKGIGGAVSARTTNAATLSSPSSMPLIATTTTTAPSFSTSTFAPSSYAEIRQYTLHPSKTADFIATTADTVHLRNEMPFLAMLQCDIGDLNTITHFYLYDDLSARDRTRASLASKKEWTADYLPVSRACVASQTSMLVQVEAEVAAGARRLARAKGEDGEAKEPPSGVFDFTVASRSLTAAAANDTSRGAARALASERHGGVLALRGHVIVGTGSPHVTVGSHVEVWRFADAADAVSGRSAADAPAVGVSRQLLRPLPYSSWQ